jgi:hypothetical protein
MSWLPRHWKASLTAVVLFAIGLGVGIGSGSIHERTRTEVLTQVRTKQVVKRVVKTRTVRVQPTVTRTVTKTRTSVVTQPPTSSFLDYGEWDGYFQAYGVEGYIEELGWKVVGQLEYLGGLPNCGRISYAQIDATFFQGGRIVATEFTNMTSAPQGSRVPFSIDAIQRSGDFRYELLLTQVSCE